MVIRTEGDAIRFMETVKFALRYDSTPTLPLPSMYAAAGDQRLAIELTNALLGSGTVVETNVIANRLVLVHRDTVPFLLAVRKRHCSGKLTREAERTFKLIEMEGTATAGGVRKFLGVEGMKRPDAADLALAELQREMLIDRGPSSVPKTGIPYLSKEGYPYRVFESAHAELVSASRKISVESAIRTIAGAFGASGPKKIATMFKLCFNGAEMKLALGFQIGPTADAGFVKKK